MTHGETCTRCGYFEAEHETGLAERSNGKRCRRFVSTKTIEQADQYVEHANRAQALFIMTPWGAFVSMLR